MNTLNNEVLKQAGTTIVDVRSAGEFASGHVDGALNIPLHEVPSRLEEFKQMAGPIVVYCRSGNRSGQAQGYLIAQGLQDVYNGGGLADMKIRMLN